MARGAGTARLIAGLLLAMPAGAQDASPKLCTVSGSVVNSVTGAPLGKTDVLLEGGRMPMTTTTDAKGAFTLVDVPAGQYQLKAVRNGYLPAYYGARSAHGKGTALRLEQGDAVKDLQIKLQPFGVIGGTIRDPDGEALSGATVYVFRQSYDEQGRRAPAEDWDKAVTDDQGQYRIPGLAPGRYYVQAFPDAPYYSENGSSVRAEDIPRDHSPKSAGPRLLLLGCFYPGVTGGESARTVEVTAGAHVGGVDFALVRSPVYRVVVHPSTAAGLRAGYADLSLSGGGMATRFTADRRSENGDLIFPAVPPGSYLLQVNAFLPEAPQPPGTITFLYRERLYRSRIPIVVGGDMEVRVAVGTGADVSGRIVVEGDEKPQLAGGRIVFSDGSDETVEAMIQQDLTFTTGLYPGKYDVSMEFGRGPLVVKRVLADGADVTQEGLAIGDGAKPSLEVTVAPDGGVVEGVVTDEDGKPLGGATVLRVVAEKKLRWRRGAFRTATTDQYGRFQFEGVAPGDYKLFAWQDVEPNIWFDAEFLKDYEDRGEKVSVTAKGRAGTQLKVLEVK